MKVKLYKKDDGVEVVKVGVSFPGLFFNYAWLMYKKMWWLFLSSTIGVWMLYGIIFKYAFILIGRPELLHYIPILMTITWKYLIPFSLFLGGNERYEEYLVDNGWKFYKEIEVDNYPDAHDKYYRIRSKTK